MNSELKLSLIGSSCYLLGLFSTILILKLCKKKEVKNKDMEFSEIVVDAINDPAIGRIDPAIGRRDQAIGRIDPQDFNLEVNV